jgi:ABC-type transport system substrate-binding protein
MREGVQFHQGWGEMTAEDVAWYFNLLNTVTNPESKHDTGVQIFDLASAEVIDRYTVRFNWLGFGGYTLMQEFTDLQEGVEVSSKKAFEDKGADWLLENLPIGTGPYEIQKWIQNEEIRLVAVADHWAKVPYISRVSVLAVPEGSTRRAMLESHQVQAAEIGLKDMPAMADLGFRLAPEVIQGGINLSFTGNYWENTNAQTGEALERERDISVPWIGDPFELGSTYDENTPSMQNSKKVRTALSLDIDRELIAETILSGIGFPISVAHMSTDDALLAKYEGRWDIPYDPAAAKQLLIDAGFPDGFDADIWTGPSGIGVEIWDAVGSIWLNDLNVTPVFDRTDYYAKHRPAIVSRTATAIHSACCFGLSTWPMEWSETSYNFPAGYNVGFESPKTSQLYLDKRRIADPVAVEQLGVDQYDFYKEWMVNVGIVRYPAGPMYDPQFMEWDEGRMRPIQWGKLGGLRSFEWIQLK